MKVLISEYSSGFADSTYPLCNELAKYEDIELTYLSDKNNDYMELVDDSVKKHKFFNIFASDDKHKRGSFRWMMNRGMVAIANCRKRNWYVKKNRPDIVLIELTMASIDSKYIKQLRKYCKVIYTVHDVIVPSKSLSWSISSLKTMYDTADAMIVHTKINKRQLEHDFNVPSEKISVIPHGIEVSYKKMNKADCRRKLGIELQDQVLLFYGGIRESKGLDILLEALKGTGYLLIIAGAMPYGKSFEQYRSQIVKNKIRTLEFLTFTEDSFRDILFQAADFLVLPYKEFYSQSGVLMQAIRYRLPVIATDVGAFREYIEKYDIGYCCGANNVDALVAAIGCAINENKRFNKQLEIAANENSWENSGKMYRELFKKVMKD